MGVVKEVMVVEIGCMLAAEKEVEEVEDTVQRHTCFIVCCHLCRWEGAYCHISSSQAEGLPVVTYLLYVSQKGQVIPARERGCGKPLPLNSFNSSSSSLLSMQVDYREPNVIRVAPVPLYNTFSEVQKFYILLSEAMDSLN